MSIVQPVKRIEGRVLDRVAALRAGQSTKKRFLGLCNVYLPDLGGGRKGFHAEARRV